MMGETGAGPHAYAGVVLSDFGHLAGTLCAPLALAALVVASPARAAELLLAAPSACAIGDELSFRAERALGQPLDSAADVRCTVHIRRDGASYAARLEVQAMASPAPSRVRSFSAPSCEMLTETLALAVSLAIASGAPEPEPAAPAAGAARGAAAASSNQAPSVPVDAGDSSNASDGSARGDRARWRLGGGAALVADAGTLPGLGMGAALGASFGVEAVNLRLFATYLPSRDAQVAPDAALATTSPGAEFQLLAGSLLACAPGLARAAELTFGACAGAELGWLSGRGTGLTVARSGESFWRAARADAEARWTLAQGLGVDFRVSALVPWKRD
jgi:hypothetical protein